VVLKIFDSFFQIVQLFISLLVLDELPILALKSPIAKKLLRNSRQALEDHILDVVFNDMPTYFMVSLFCFTWAMLEWRQFHRKASPHPEFMTRPGRFSAVGVEAMSTRRRVLFTR
jgi:hypothetical protein